MVNASYQPGERRPIAARGLWISQRAASWLAHRHFPPNAISLAGMGCAQMAGLALSATASAPECERAAWLAALLLIVLRLLANMLDGMVAIESGRASRVGELFNEVPDRVSDASIFIGLGYARLSVPILGYLAAVLAVFTAYVRAMGKVAGAPQFYQGPMAKPQRMCVVMILCIWAVLLPDTLAIRFPEHGLAIPGMSLAVIVLGCVTTAIRRLVLIRNALREPSG